MSRHASNLIEELNTLQFGEYSKLNGIYGRIELLISKNEKLKAIYLPKLLEITTHFSPSKGSPMKEALREGYHWKETIQKLNNILLFLRDEIEFAQERKITNKEDYVDVFISHSKHDADTARLLIDLIRSALNLSPERIRCTSVNGYRLKSGTPTNDQLKKEVHESRVLIGLISEKSIESAYVLFELGARWGASLPLKPLIISNLGPDLLKGPLSGINSLNLFDEGQLHQLIEELSEELNVLKASSSVYQEKIEIIIKHLLQESKQSNVPIEKIDGSKIQEIENIDLKIKDFCDKEWPDDYTMKVHCIKEQKEAASEMKNIGPNDIPANIFKNIVQKAIMEWPDNFVMMVHRRDEQIEAYRELQKM